MTATLERAGITEPGVYDLSHHAYHSDPALSSTSARKLLPPSCPALYRYELENPPESSGELDKGTVAHQLLLGSGPEPVVVEEDSWRTKIARVTRADAHLDGRPALLRKDYNDVLGMVAALKRDPAVQALLAREWGTAETSIFWRDIPTGIMRRARLDWCPVHDPRRRDLVVDYKTAESAEPDAFKKAVERYLYHVQGATYLEAAKASGRVGDDAKFLFIVQEKRPPYLVQVIELDSIAMRIGQILNRRAVDIYAQCLETETWPGYADDVALVSLPPWYENQFTEQL